MTQRTQNIIVGITTMAGLAGLAVMLMLFGNVSRLWTDGYSIRVTFNEAGGLSPGSRVRLSGIDIGQVTAVHFQEPAHRGVVVTLRINPAVRVPADSRVTIDRPLLGGSPALSFVVEHLAEQADVPMLPTDGSAVLHGETSSLAGQFERTLREEFKEPKEQLKRVADELERLSTTWREVGTNINQLVQPRDLQAVDNGQAPGNLATVLARTDQRLREMEQVLGGIRAYVGDEQIRSDFKATMSNAREVSQKARELTESAHEQLDRVSRRIHAVADDMSAAIQSTRQLVEQARTGPGTVGQLLNNPSVYNNLDDASRRVSEAVDDLRLLIEKWRDEGLPVKF